MDFEKYFGANSIVASILIGWFLWLFGVLDKVLLIFATLMVIDYLTGVLGAWFAKTWSSDVGRKGIIKKVCLILLIIVAHLCDMLSNTGDAIRSSVTLVIIGNELMSILENIGKITYIPEPLRKVLVQIRDTPAILQNISKLLKTNTDEEKKE
jgi:toxin secretion/phage lysis holin